MSHRDRRISTSAEFSRILTARQCIAGQYLRVHYVASTQLHARLGMSVSRRHAGGSAVQRNRIRRRLSECFRLRTNTLSAVDIVATLYKTCSGISQARAAAAEFDNLLSQMHIRA